jgi:hypothetical protein
MFREAWQFQGKTYPADEVPVVPTAQLDATGDKQFYQLEKR